MKEMLNWAKCTMFHRECWKWQGYTSVTLCNGSSSRYWGVFVCLECGRRHIYEREY